MALPKFDQPDLVPKVGAQCPDLDEAQLFLCRV